MEEQSQKAIIARHKITISGFVKHVNGNTIPDLKVVLNEKKLRGKTQLAESISNSRGFYSITIDAAKYNPAYILEVKNKKGSLLFISEPFFKPEEKTSRDLIFNSSQYKGKSAFELRKPVLRKYWEELNAAAGYKLLSIEDIHFIASQSGQEPRDTFHWMRAHELEAETKIPAEAFYGMFKSGMPTNLKALSSMDGKALSTALKKAAENSFISDDLAKQAKKIVNQWNDYIIGKALQNKPDKIDASLGDILSTVVSDSKMLKKILNAYLNHEGTLEEFWTSLYKITKDKNSAGQIQMVLKLGVLSGNQPDMINALMNESLRFKFRDLFQHLAGWDEKRWVNYVSKLSEKNKKSVVPSFVEGTDESHRVQNYAGRIAKTLEKTFPTHSFFGKLRNQKPEESAFSSSHADLLTFFENNPSFDFKSDSTVFIDAEDSEFSFEGVKNKISLARELQCTQRLMSYTSSFQAISELKADGLESAIQIIQLPQDVFIQKYTPAFGSKRDATVAYKKAEKNYMVSVTCWANNHPGINSGMFVTSFPYTTADWRTLFGSPDACECEHCASVFSMYAYYADILNFLNKRAPDVYQELIRRRGDLAEILLTCKNTNTALPYIDLVNELLENFVVRRSTLNIDNNSYQTTWQENELVANPEHLDDTAYEQLKKAVYPRILPFNLPLEEARIYLNHLGVRRDELMTAFFTGTSEEAFNDFDICMERLNISVQEGKILSGETTGDATPDSGLWNFYGFNKSTGFSPLTDPADSGKSISGASWVTALTSRVDVFLQQTGLTYKEMLTMLLCHFINPETGIVVNGNPLRKIVIVSTDAGKPDTCQLDLLSLKEVEEGISGEISEDSLRKIHRFIRLWRRLGWNMYDLDKAVLAFNLDFGNDTDRNKNSLKKISQVEFFRHYFNLPVDSVLAFWANIDSTAYIDYLEEKYPPVPSLYEKLFRNKTVLYKPDEKFTENPSDLTGNMDELKPAIYASLQINDIDYSWLKSDITVCADNYLNLENLSSFYRNTLLAKKLNLTVKDFRALKSLIGIDSFSDPLSTFSFLLKYDTVQSFGFSQDQLNYILRHQYLEETAVAPADNDISVFLSQLRSSLRSIETSTPEEQKNTIIQKFSEKLKITTSAARLLLVDFLKGIINTTESLVNDFRSDDFSINAFLKTYTDTATNSDYQPVFVRENIQSDPKIVKVSELFDGYIRLEKIATIIKKLKLSDEELEYILSNYSKIGCTNLSVIPIVATSSSNFAEFESLINLIKARDLMPVGSPGYFEIIDKNDKVEWIDSLQKRTNWDRESIDILLGEDEVHNGILSVDFPMDFRNGNLVLKLKKCLSVIVKIGLNPDLISKAIQPDPYVDTSNDIKNTARAKYNEIQWAKLAKPLRDGLREKQRESLVAYLLAHPNYDSVNYKSDHWKNSIDLYDYLLIDVEMKPLSMTSRIKQAICSVQLFIDRVLMNLEHKNSNPDEPMLQLGGEQVEEWKAWRKLYRIWEADRRIFLYPENWIEPELRDDKSPFFKELEAQLKQNELNTENVEEAFHGYLAKLDEVARLEMVGLYHQLEPATDMEDAVDTLHVFARTYSLPHKYFHRTLENNEWSSWKRLEIDIDGNHIVPVVFNRKLCLFWLYFTEESNEQEPLNPNADTISPPARYWKIQVAWSEYRKNKWTAKRMSKSYIKSQDNSISTTETLYKGCWLSTFIIGDKLYAIIENTGNEIDTFIFNNTNDDPYTSGSPFIDVIIHTQGIYHITEDKQKLLANVAYQPFELYHGHYDEYNYPEDIYTEDPYPILNKTGENLFNLVVPSKVEDGSLYTKFFFQDSKNTFLVTHSQIFSLLNASPNFGLKDWNKDLLAVWGDLLINNQIEEPANPAVKRETELDEYFSNPMPDIIKYKDKAEVKVSHMNSSAMYYSNGSDTPSATFDNYLSYSAYLADRQLLEIGGILVTKFKAEDRFAFTTFYHAHVKDFIRELYKLGVKGLMKRELQALDDNIKFLATYDPTNLVRKINNEYPGNKVDFRYGSTYSQYNWELFFHVPMLIACRLKDDQRFEEAREWFHYIFDPTTSEGGGKERFWQFLPFYEEAGKEIETLDDLLHNEAKLDEQVSKWMANPFKPHVIARMRISAYMRNVVLKYLDNLISWGDNLFRRDTIESINEATNLYILAAKILGERPQEIPPRAKHNDMTFNALKDILDPFSNPVVPIETMISPSLSPSSETISGTSNSLGNMFYLCVPRNEYLMKYWDTVADRLFKIRHSMNIEGFVRTLPLFEPPIDPALLVRAAAAGMDLSSILSDMNAQLPFYRFSFMLQKANELTNEVKSLGSALLQALEKRDGEALSLLRSAHEQKLLKAVLSIKESQVEDAKKSLESIKKSLEIANLKYSYYSTRPFMNGLEAQHLNSVQIGLIYTAIQGEIETIAGTLASIPDLKIGAPTSIGTTWGGTHIAGMMRAFSSYLGIYSAINNVQGAMASTLGSYTRRMDDWKFQSSSAGKEIQQLEIQQISNEIKLAIAEKDLQNQQLQIQNSIEVDEFMRNKFTSQELYDWMTGQISTVYFQSYQLAYDLAKKAEKCYKHERGDEGESKTSFIQFGYWDSLKKGLLSAEKLQFDLRRMETAYYEKNEREYEITKHIALSLLDPLALIELRLTGTCNFEIPEVLFDLDYPGHYFRRIKSVSITMPCIAGPYTPVNSRLLINSGRYRKNTEQAESGYSEKPGNDERFVPNSLPVQSIVTSNAQNDSGVFELNFRDERYLPFEGCGAISNWTLELPNEVRLFNYGTISDVIIHMKYTARGGEEILKIPAHNALVEKLFLIKQALTETGLHVALNMKHDLPNEWQVLLQKGSVDLVMDKSRLPYMAQPNNPRIESLMVISPSDISISVNEVEIQFTPLVGSDLSYGSSTEIEIEKPFKLMINQADLDNLKKLILVVKYKFDIKQVSNSH